MKSALSLIASAIVLAGPLFAQPFFAFDNGLNDVEGFDEKAALLADLGYDGIGWRPGRTTEMLAALDKHGLKMFSTYVTLKADMENCPIPQDVASEIKALKGRETMVWLNVAGKSTDEVVVPAIRKLCDLSAEVGLKVVIYPHVGCHTDTVANSLRMVKAADRKNLGVSLNLCHFLKQNDEADLEKTIRAAAPHLWLVSINGCDSGDTKSMNWDRLIRPLGEGTFSVAEVMRLLDEVGYEGPVGLQCYQIKQAAEKHLAKSMGAWKTAEPKSKPNVLFIAIDDLNNYVGCMGDGNARTPNLDRLAKRGTLFTNAHCQAPICGPSRASLMTGLLPSTTGVYGQIGDKMIRNASPATRKAVFLPDFLEEQGYHTVGCGKIFHQGDKAGIFDEFGHGSNMGPKPKKRLHYNPAWFLDRIGGTQTDWGAYPERDDQMPDHRTADWVLDKLAGFPEAGEKRKPFFLAAGFCRPHVPWYVPQKWFDLHPLEGIKTPPYKADDYDDLPPISIRVNEAPMMPAMDWVLAEPERWRGILQAYLASTTFTDHQLGRLLDALEASPFAADTIIVVWSDHGYHLGEKGRFAKQSLWEQATRVPLIIAGPGLPRGRTCHQPAQLLDIYPTLLELLGLPPNPRNDGRSLVPLLKNPAADWPHAALTTYGPGNHAVQTTRYRYIQYEDGAAELYDHQSDPNEWTNLADDPGKAAIIGKLRKFIPATSAPNAKDSKYNFNEYFRKALKQADRPWLGAEYWARPMEQWQQRNGRFEVKEPPEKTGGYGLNSRNLRVFHLTRQIGERKGAFRMTVNAGRQEGEAALSDIGFQFGIKSPLGDYRSAIFRGRGTTAGIALNGGLFIGDSGKAEANPSISQQQSVKLVLSCTNTRGKHTLTLEAHGPDNKLLDKISQQIPDNKLPGDVALISNFLTQDKKARRKHWFGDWTITGDKIDVHPDQRFGPILWTQYTLSRKVMKMTVQMPLMGADDDKFVSLQVRDGQNWSTIAKAPIDPLSLTALIRVENWDDGRDHDYRAVYHLDIPDNKPIKRGISVYHGDMVYGRVSFAILADRMFKTAPGQLVDWFDPNWFQNKDNQGRPDHLLDPDYDVATIDFPQATLLGERQLEFLETWAKDWRGADQKCVLSQTIFCSLSNYHGRKNQFYVADLDSNGWPQNKRNMALDVIRRGYGFMVAGDQHLSSVVHHGIDKHKDAGFSFPLGLIPRSLLRLLWRS